MFGVFQSEIKVILTIYGDVKFWQLPSCIFFQRGQPMILGQNFKFLVTFSVVKMNLEMMSGDVFGQQAAHPDHIWRCQIVMAAILDFFQMGQAMILGQNFKFLVTLSVVKMDSEMVSGDVFGQQPAHPDHMWRCQIVVAAILDFFPKGLACDFGSKFQISCNFVCRQNGPGKDVQ